MCGPSNQEKTAAADQQSLASSLAANYNQNYATQSALLGRINSTLSPIIAAGPNQNGLNAQQLSAMNTQILDTTSANYKNAARAAATAGAAGNNGAAAVSLGPQNQIDA